MDILHAILNPPAPASYEEFYKSLLSVSGVLFGLAFAGLLFILQSGFSSFKYSRRMFLILYLHFGRQILYSLSYLTIIPFIVLYFPDHLKIASIIYLIFSLMILKATLDHAKEEGYLVTINSYKFVPRKYGRFRSYLRFIRNLGLLRNVFHFIPIIFVLIYPLLIAFVEHHTAVLTPKSFLYSSLFILILSLLRITFFIPEYFQLQEMEVSYNLPSDEKLTEKKREQNLQAKQALKAYLNDRQIRELNGVVPVDFLGGELSLHFLENSDSDEAFFNVNVEIKGESPEVIRLSIFEYAYHIFRFLNESRVDINKFVLSFHIDVGDGKNRNIFIRTNRKEIVNLYSRTDTSPEKILEFENLLIDPLFE